MNRRQPASRVKLKPEAVWSYLNRLNMSQNELARRVGISSGYLSQLMSGTRCPSAAVRVSLMDVLGVTDFDELFILEIVPPSEANDVPTPTRAGIVPTTQLGGELSQRERENAGTEGAGGWKDFGEAAATPRVG